MNVESERAASIELFTAVGGQKPVGVLAADLVGYSDMVFRDLQGAIAVLLDGRAVLSKVIAKYHGKVVETPGDFVLAIFHDPSTLLAAAVESQIQLLEHLKQKDSFSAGHWKIGLEFGDVHAIDGGYYGNAINIAARLQALAAPGEVWFTNKIAQETKLPDAVKIETLGQKQLKNIGEPINVFRARLPEYTNLIGVERADETAPARLGESLKKPVLQIKQFRSIGDGDRGSLISEALADEISLILSRLSGSIIVVQDSGSVTPDYVLHGSIQEEDHNIRVMGRLVSTSEGNTVWADRFESDLRGTFDLQDQIARDIVSALQLMLTEGEQAQLWRRSTTSGKAWEAFQRGRDQERRYTREGHSEAKTSYREALSYDENYLSALVALGFCYLDEIRLGWSPDQDASLSKAAELCSNAQALADDHPDVLSLAAYIAYFNGNEEHAREVMRRSVMLSPQSSEILAYEGALFDLMGDFKKAAQAYKDALSLSPSTPAWIATNLGLSLLALQDSIEAEPVFKEVLNHYPEYARAWLGLTVALVQQGRLSEARSAASSLLKFDRRFKIQDWAKSAPFSDREILTRFIEDLRAAGLV